MRHRHPSLVIEIDVDVEKSPVEFVKDVIADREHYVIQLDVDEVSDVGNVNKLEARKGRFRLCIRTHRAD